MKIKDILYALPIVFLFLSSGCSEKNEDSNSTKKQNQTTSSPKIEIVHNSNAMQIKVEEKTAPKDQDKAYYLNYDIKSNYDPNAQPANKDASVRVKPRTATDAAMHTRSPYEKVKISMLVKRLSKNFILKCSACHNDYANGIIGPSLLHKTSDEIIQKIADFKSGKKSNPLMKDLISMMSDEEIQKLANEIYQFNIEIKKLGNK